METIVILGTGVAGDEAAFAAKKTDPNARVVMFGQEPYPLYSACVLADYISGELPRERVMLRRSSEYAEIGIELFLSSVVRDWLPQDRMLLFNDGGFAYDKLILATGSKPFVPPIPQVEKTGVYTLKTIKDAEHMRAAEGHAAVVVGSGPVGIEVAIAFRKRGWSVTIVELMDRILPRLFDSELTNTLTTKLRTRGISVLTGEKVVEVHGNSRVRGIRTDRRDIPADVVVMVAGMIPEVTLARKGGIEIGASKGIFVNSRMETSLPGVWACGDCIESTDLATGRKGVFMLWSNARIQGRIAGANAAGKDRRYPGSLNVTTVKFFDEAAASVGCLAGDAAEDEVRIVHSKKWWGELWMVFIQERLTGIQVLGQIERVGGLMGTLLRGEDIRSMIGKARKGVFVKDLWALDGIDDLDIMQQMKV